MMVRQRRELAAELTELAVVEQQLTLQQLIAQPVLDGQRYVRLAPVSGTGPSVIWVSPVGKAPYIAAPSLPALPPDRTYQLWFLQGSKPLPSVTFRSGSDTDLAGVARRHDGAGCHCRAAGRQPSADDVAHHGWHGLS